MPKFTAYDGTELAYHLVGTGKPLICLPGGAMRASAYLGDLGGLSAHRQLVLLDLRGTGDSPVPEDVSSYRCDRMADDVEALREHLGLDTVDLLAHSASGNLATLYAAAHPRRIGSLVLVTPGIQAVGLKVTQDDWRSAVALREGESWYAEGRAAFEEIRGGRDPREVWAAVQPFMYGRWDEAAQEHAAGEDAQINRAAAAVHYQDGVFDPAATTAALAAVDAPVLVVAGAHDATPTPERAAELTALFPRGELTVLPGAGHFPWLDAPGDFVRTLAAFLEPGVRSVRTASGLRLAYRVQGEESAPPVVLVHGRGGSGTDWTGIAEALAATRRVYALDLRGHGLSDWPGRYSFEGFRDDLRGFVDALGLAGADVVAHSMGGAAALLLAVRAPELIGRLVLEESPPLTPVVPRRGFVERPDGELSFDWPVVADIDVQLNDPDPAWRAGYAALATPTLVVAGGPDSHIDQKVIAEMAARIPGARLVTIDAGHSVHAERPEEFLAEIREFGI
ncbi:hydrolase [Streptomyces sp. ERV7]|uniref:alpha/beta fold hydrolase n=1 Tax=Streptomyces sp. ERV7 TaxID=1322334 RepID=UPI0007F38CC2|nr:alpha/beta hydrolase [Streptomyces sp. ERV7]OAR26850.1 hydrolase [Streptomyces sp. ERV7]